MMMMTALLSNDTSKRGQDSAERKDVIVLIMWHSDPPLHPSSPDDMHPSTPQHLAA